PTPVSANLTPMPAPPQLPPPTIVSPPQYPGNTTKRRNRGVLITLIVVLVILLLTSIGGAIILLYPPTPPVPATPIVGQAFYVSTGQVSPGTAAGIADQMKINLKNIPAPAAGKSYYVWLLPDRHPEPNPDDTGPRPIHPPILLTNNLPVKN